MSIIFNKGIAFICEGDTEKEFYLSLLGFLCTKHNAVLDKIHLPEEAEIAYKITTKKTTYLVKFHTVNAITALPRANKWFNVECIKKYPRNKEWIVFLCYDTDNYKAEITPFYEGDWKELRSKLKKAREIIDLAASADIEDIFLFDIDGICAFLHCPVVSIDTLHGRKGTAKIKELYRNNGSCYHKGTRARPMIDSLDKQRIMDSCPIPLNKIERLFE